MSMKNIIVGIIIIVAIVLIGYQVSNQSASEDGPIKIGYIGPFTGDAVVYGEPMRNVTELAVTEINAAGVQ